MALPDGDTSYEPTAASKSNTQSRTHPDQALARSRHGIDPRQPTGARRGFSRKVAEVRLVGRQLPPAWNSAARPRGWCPATCACGQTNLSTRGRQPYSTRHFVSRSNAKTRNVGGSGGLRVITVLVRAGEKQTVLFLLADMWEQRKSQKPVSLNVGP